LNKNKMNKRRISTMNISWKFFIFIFGFSILFDNTSFAAVTGTWTNLNPTGSIPRGRSWFPMTYHPLLKQTVVFGGGTTSGCTGGGVTGGYLNDMYTYDGGTNVWTEIHSNNSVADNVVWPYGRDNHVMTYDSYNDVLWVFGGTCGGGLWRYDFKDTDGNPWTKIPDPVGHEIIIDTLDPGFAYDLDHQKILMFGGEKYYPRNWTYLFDVKTNQWTLKTPPIAPPARAQIENALVYDSFHKVFVLFGGRICPEYPTCIFYNDTWVYNPVTERWFNMNPSISPPGIQQHTMVYDSDNKVVVLFGGGGENGLLNNTWIYDVGTNTWTEIQSTNAPPKRALHAMSYDSLNKRSIIFSGTNGDNYYTDTWALEFTIPPSNIDNTPPIISNVNIYTITSNSAEISFTTSEASMAQIEYGTTIQYGLLSILDTGLIQIHSIPLKNLSPDTTYHFRIIAIDASGNKTTSPDYTFKTSTFGSSTDTTPPHPPLNVQVR